MFFAIVFVKVSIALCVTVNPSPGPVPQHRMHYIAAASKNWTKWTTWAVCAAMKKSWIN